MGIGMEPRGLRSDGSEFPVEISLSPWPSPSGVRIVVDTAQHLSALLLRLRLVERDEAEDAWRERLAELRESLAACAENQLVHNTAWVPGHFHMTVGSAVALSIVGVSDRAQEGWALAGALTGIGGSLMTLGLLMFFLVVS